MEDHVGGDFAEDKGNEEDGGDDVVLDALEVQVNSHALNLGISYRCQPLALLKDINETYQCWSCPSMR